jgi:hypothetical protein|tara:strand:- start:336 stop:509 length:174 start_codon:yes stop_codon:yes gene_type:complete
VLDNPFGLWARDEYPGVHLEFEVEKRGTASEVLKRFAVSTAGGEFKEARNLIFCQGI